MTENVLITRDDIKKQFCEQFTSNTSLDTLWNYLKELKIKGVEKELVLSVLKELRELFKENEDIEDQILEVMDFVVGFCSPISRIWP